MRQTVKLLLPALMPSWRFFEAIAPSPRIEYALLQNPHDTPHDWQECFPKPARLSTWNIIVRLFWNPRYNESLFLVSCAERLLTQSTLHSHQEIVKRITAECARRGARTPYLQFRLALVTRHGDAMHQEIVYMSFPEAVSVV